MILSDKKLIVEDVIVQNSKRNLYGRSVRLDALCTLGDGTKCNIEVQRSNNDNHLKRVRFNAASISVVDSQKGEHFRKMEDLYVVYLSEFDVFHKGYTKYHVDSVIRETGEIVKDGLERIFVNTEIKDGTELSELMSCFLEKEVDNPKFPEFSKRMKFLKHEKGGLDAVCEVMERYDEMMEWLSKLYVDTLNMIHYMHDKYYYEAAQMSLIDTDVKRSFATGIAGFSHVVDSLSAIKYAKVKVVRDEDGLATDFEIEGDFPKYGNDDDRADEIAVWLLKKFMHKLNKCHTYRHSVPTTSILTITSNVVYGKATGSLPDGRKAGEPLSPGANPSYGAEQSGLLASLNSVAKLPYELALDGISNTQTINPGALGHSDEERKENLAHVLDGYFDQGAHHLNVNVFGVDKLKDAMEHPEKPEYANFTIRVSGYAVKFIDLTREQQLDVIARTCHDHM